ncbi:MAG: electron transfer flavoprotein subunit alpha/FixB family protein [Bryobacteraceae bacterium]|jgi:electron transfer flavoprotein alpha subunit
MKGVLAILEYRGTWNRLSWEALAAGQEAAEQLNQPLIAAVAAGPADDLAAELRTRKILKAYVVQHELLGQYTADGYVLALSQLIRKLDPALTVFPHTYQVRDFAPRLAARFDQMLISDVIGMRFEDGRPMWVRQLLQGRLNADYRHSGEGPCFVSVQAGAFRSDSVSAGAAEVELFTPELEAAEIRSKPGARFRESEQTVDLASARLIVSVGRGIKEKENLPMVEELARTLGAELAASRPICDNGWLPMDRQVGSSGQTVSPKLYLAVGISGAIQHLVGMKGSKAVVAINKDENAPIFEVADYGIAGDLFEVVPALTAAVKKLQHG